MKLEKAKLGMCLLTEKLRELVRCSSLLTGFKSRRTQSVNPGQQQHKLFQHPALESPAEQSGFPEGAQRCCRNNQTSVIYNRFTKGVCGSSSQWFTNTAMFLFRDEKHPGMVFFLRQQYIF